MAHISFYIGFMEMAREKGFEYAADYVARHGFQGVEFLEVPGDLPYLAKNEKEAVHLANILKENGLNVSCLSAAVNLWDNPSQEEDLKQLLPIVAGLGSPYLHHMLISWLKYPDNAPSYEDALPVILEKAHRVAEEAAKYGITCLYEGQGLYFNGVKGMDPFLSDLKKHHTNVGIVGDVGNPLFSGCDPVDFIRHFASDIKHVHLKDYTIRTFDSHPGHPWLALESGAHSQYVFEELPGHGDIRLDECLEALRKVNYQGSWSIESVLDPMEEDIQEVFRYTSEKL